MTELQEDVAMDSPRLEPIEKEKPISKTLRKRAINQYDMNGILLRCYKNAGKAARQIGCDASLILKCCNGKYSSVDNFKWSFA